MPTRTRQLSEAFGVVIRLRRIERRLTQERLSSRAKLNRTYVSDLERGLKSPTLEVVESLALALGTQAHALVEAAENARSRKAPAGTKRRQRFRASLRL